ncbi:MAG: NAD(+) synthase [Bacteroides sp.]|nr:NAD(+) synthase [Bacteroides sp.]
MKYSDYRRLGFRRVAAAVPGIRIADVNHNVEQIAAMVADAGDCDLIVFPELCVSGYTCADLFLQTTLLDSVQAGLVRLAHITSDSDTCIVVGAPLRYGNKLYNCAVYIRRGSIIGIVPKVHVPNYGEFYEQRWFASGGDVALTSINLHNQADVPFGRDILIECEGMVIATDICEDLWVPVPPSSLGVAAGANVVVNLSASNETIGKHRYRRELISQQSARSRCAYIYASAGPGESSTDLVFPGYAAVCEDGTMLAESDRFSHEAVLVKADIDIQSLDFDRRRTNTFPADTETPHRLVPSQSLKHSHFNDGEHHDEVNIVEFENRAIDPHPFVPADPVHKDENCTEIIHIQCLGLRQRLSAINCRTLVVGISGGLDSTLALLVACRTFDLMDIPRSGIVGITMPGLATTDRTRDNAWQLMERLGVTAMEIPIGKAVAGHFEDIGQNPAIHDATYENSQARERTQILMDMANKTGGIVLGTGDLSELALGWCTYNGDHMSMYGVNASVPKTLVKHLVEWFASRTPDEKEAAILRDIIDTPISPELVPSDDPAQEIAQKTEDLVGPYELHDFFLFNMLRHGFSPTKTFHLARKAFRDAYDDATILKWMRTFYRRFFSQQFKRSCMPDGPKVGSVCLSPRGDWRMPSDASASLWLAEIDALTEKMTPKTEKNDD